MNKNIDDDLKCAPNINYENGSCISLNLLLEMIKAYNLNNPDTQILEPIENIKKNKKLYKIYCIDALNSKLSICNNNQICWTKQNFIKHMDKTYHDELKYFTFRPNGPNNSFKWLNTINITNVVLQYEKKYNDFKYLGTYPMDFDNMHDLYFENNNLYNLKNINFVDLLTKNKNKFGAVFNLDKHNEDGSHWVSFFFNCEKNNGFIYYFDSTGEKPTIEILNLIKRCKEQYVNYFNNDVLNIKYNNFKHQLGDSECGVYSINFILRLLKGDSFAQISKKRISDQKIHKCRKIYFN